MSEPGPAPSPDEEDTLEADLGLPTAPLPDAAAGAAVPPDDGVGGPRLRPFSIGGRPAGYEWVGLGLILLAYAVMVALSVRSGPPLGWDEAVYTLRARDFVAGADPAQYWMSYRAPGLPWLGHLLWFEGREATVLRLLVGGFGALLVATSWLLTRHLFGRRAALVAAAGVALTPSLLLAATQVWPDVPGACLGLLAITLFTLSTGGERPSWWVLAAVPVMGAATYLRFGAPLPMAIGLLGVAWWRRRTLLRHPWPVIVTALAGAALVVAILEVPFMTGGGGTPFGAISGADRVFFSGWFDYLGMAEEVVGPAAVVLGLAGLVAGLAFAGKGIDRGALLTACLVGLVTAAVIATILHGELRYLAPAYPWLWVAGAPGLVFLGALIPGRGRAWAVAALAVALVAGALGATRERNQDAAGDHRAMRRAAEAIAAEAAGRPCVVVTSRTPQVLWYSGCDVGPYKLAEVRFPAPKGRMVFMLYVSGFPHQPSGETLEAYREAAGDPLLVVEGRRWAEAYLVSVPPASG